MSPARCVTYAAPMDDYELMGRALAQVRGVLPIGAVLAHGGEPLAEAHWRERGRRGLLMHPEHRVMLTVDESLAWRSRLEVTLYTTLEPCLMCMGTAMSFRLGRIVYAMSAPADGAADVAQRWAPRLGHPDAACRLRGSTARRRASAANGGSASREPKRRRRSSAAKTVAPPPTAASGNSA